MSVENRPEYQRGLLDQRDLERLDWREDLSEEGQKLYEFLLGDVGDVEILSIFAGTHKLDLKTTLDELRSWGILDERDPLIIRIRTQT